MPSANIAEWMILFACPPGKPQEPAGILLLDKSSDQLFFRLKTRLSTSDDEINEVWNEITLDFKNCIGQSGGDESITWLELTASHTLRVSDRRFILAENLATTVDQLYESNIGSYPSRSALDVY